ncbi:thiamine ABC transporter ATP-binding protein [Mesorhizobium sp.]|uniref:thiamine ABC transporter ATP-binding protein n=1 Tax=Mesorhizobium sp. TaxID=1871066 RepID=UPI000FE3D0CF|nr:thiamine ABC transporter ATP-binding protein [Mesorhizobium sp.]RWA70144.1 MAG: thiamine ABC transporter ATP-binding protein [Mesorhizobium sp.]RWB99051.1 MAG: thiamine ABC transporter ATP-binding protein [Mesorhizobium sp.]RWG80677.1 MAG: thiamine ABC transporter ATP-binding protein [Mesorhizobium sp.]RWG86443.1 MAG: thiamine ABC transporter ATP-binding protein [Mesorhizobium sp.]RWK04562.1 MAG: thiamine ABC transporter ATP-binding protein [Mesorhizobium sp.]
MTAITARKALAVTLDDVSFSYGEASFRFDAEFAAGRITAIMGPSGSGKSTLLNLIAGFEAPSAGKVLIGGIDVGKVPPSARPVSMVFQENNLFAHLSVEGNVGLGRSPSLKLTSADRQAVAEALARVGLSGKASRLPRELSGGERQRVALARVLLRDRPVLLLDEPFASLGPALRDDMLDLVAGIHAERRMTVLFVTHQPEDARRIGEEIAFVDEGRVAATGPAADFFDRSGPDAFRRYIGDRGDSVAGSQHIARKRT